MQEKINQDNEQKYYNDFESNNDDVLIGDPRFILDTPPATWKGPKYYSFGTPKRSRTIGWIFIGSAVILFILGVNFITTAVIGMLGILIMLNGIQKSPTIEFFISEYEIRVGEQTYKPDDIDSFALFYLPSLEVHELSLKLKKWHKPYLRIPLQSQNPVHIRELLLDSIPEEEHEESLGEVITRSIGL